jgi:hypothetical protein
VLVWILTVLAGGQKTDAVWHAQTDPVFPLNPTKNQIYDQIQFEAYRQSGHTSADNAFSDKLVEEDSLTRRRLDEMFEKMFLARASAQRLQ